MFDSLSVDFAHEALDLLRQLEEALLSLEGASTAAPCAVRAEPDAVGVDRRGERDGDGDDDGAPAVVAAAVQRLLHTLKGNAGLVGAVDLQRALHGLEDRAEALAARPAQAGAMLPALDVLRGEVEALAAGRAVDATGEPLRRMIDEFGVEDAARAAAAALQTTAAVADPDAVALEASAPGAASASASLSVSPLAPDGLADELRVSQPRVDALLAAAGDLLVQSGRLQRLAAAAPGREGRALHEAVEALHAGLRAVHGELLKLRTVPVAQLFARMRRLVRDEARAAGKQVRLTMSGAEVGADKAVLDALLGALVHLVRNAVAHGVETPERRAAAGKPAEGEVRLGAALRGAVVELTVEDDGAGFDEAAIARRARALGRDPDADPSALIFEPGFSTAPALSASAGRGVGLDAVRAAVYALGGSVEASARPGRGARFALRVPATIALQRALLCGIGEETYAIPTASVVEATRLAAEQVRWLGRGRAMEHRGGLLPLVETERQLGAEAREGAYAVILSAGGLCAALRVDALLGQQEFVFQPVPAEVRGRGPVSGGALLADGRVVLRLNAEGLVAVSAARAPRAAGAGSGAGAGAGAGPEVAQ